VPQLCSQTSSNDDPFEDKLVATASMALSFIHTWVFGYPETGRETPTGREEPAASVASAPVKSTEPKFVSDE
jgi:hypothetical protein